MSAYNVPRHDDGPEVVPYSHLEPVIHPFPKSEHSYAIASQPEKTNTILGLRRTTFFLSIALAIAVATAGVVGGVLGSQIASDCSEACAADENDSAEASDTASASASSSSAPSSTATTDFVAPTDAILALDCDSSKNPYKGLWIPGDRTYEYEVTCGKDCPSNDILTFWAYSMEHCMHACVSFNERNLKDSEEEDVECEGVVWSPELEMTERHGGNCFLKRDCSSTKDQDGTVFAIATFVD